MAEIRLQRSMLYTPGDRAERIEKAIDKGEADLVVADLEDAVALEDKPFARESVRAVLDATRDTGTRTQRCVRINPFATGLAHADLAAVMGGAPDVVVLPKAESREDVLLLDAVLGTHERREGLQPGATRIIPIIETARGVHHAGAIAAASPRVAAIAFGAEDLAADADLVRSRSNTEVYVARSLIALAAAAAGVDALDQVFVAIEDTAALANECREARTLGYSGKMLIHPAQIAPTHTAFAPSVDELRRAEALVAAVDSAETDTGGVLRFDGKMIDVPLVRQARRVMALARASAQK